MARIRHTILVLSGKGGVGKSTFSAQLAFALAAAGGQVLSLLESHTCEVTGSELAFRLQPAAARCRKHSKQHTRHHGTARQRRQPRMLGSACMVVHHHRQSPRRQQPWVSGAKTECAPSAGGAAGCGHLRAVGAAHAGPGGPRHPLLRLGGNFQPPESCMPAKHEQRNVACTCSLYFNVRGCLCENGCITCALASRIACLARWRSSRALGVIATGLVNGACGGQPGHHVHRLHAFRFFAALHSKRILGCHRYRAGPRCMWRTTWASCPSASCCQTRMTPSSGGAPARTGSLSRHGSWLHTMSRSCHSVPAALPRILHYRWLLQFLHRCPERRQTWPSAQ